jgi:hypothetical protein
MSGLSPVNNTEYLLERLVGAALMTATALFFLAGAVNLLGYFFAAPCAFLALWFLFPNKPKAQRDADAGHRVEQLAEEIEWNPSRAGFD